MSKLVASRIVWEKSAQDRGHAAFRVLLALSEFALTGDGVSWPARERLLAMLQVHDRHFRRCVGELVKAGELETREAVDGRTVYRIVLEGFEPIDYPRLQSKRIELRERFSDVEGSTTQDTDAGSKDRRAVLHDRRSACKTTSRTCRSGLL